MLQGVSNLKRLLSSKLLRGFLLVSNSTTDDTLSAN
ncbi:hypothetical protein [Providencia phage PSTRCR_128]|nr:hypothetical protein [Providencia phage PSTRCR_128]